MTTTDYNCLPTSLQMVSSGGSAIASLVNAQTITLLRNNSSCYSNLHCIDMCKVSEFHRGAFLSSQVTVTAILYFHDSKWTVFDFATESQAWADRYRKLYNSILTLDRIGCCSLDESREQVDYVFVTSQVPSKIRAAPGSTGAVAVLHQHFDRCTSRPWEFDVQKVRLRRGKIVHDLRKMSEYLVRRAYYVFPSELDQYASNSGWSN